MASAAASSTLGGKEEMAQRPDALQSLRDEVQEIIRPYTTADKEPPFSGGELIVMALVDTDDDTLSEDRILRWTIDTFKYYNAAFVDQAFQHPGPFNFRIDLADTVFENITKAFTEYEVPVREGRTAIGKRSISVWSITAQAARVYLRRWLEPEREGIFPFLNLPPETRNHIYELIFTFPSSGICMHDTGNLFLERIDEPGPCGRKWSHSLFRTSRSFVKKTSDDILTLLCANRQVYEEAMPFFYRLNNFYFNSYSYSGQLVNLPRSRLEHLRKLHLDLTETIQDWLLAVWPDITKALSTKAMGFIELTISTTDDAWLGHGIKARKYRKCGVRTSTFSCIEELPGFADLAVAVAKATVVRWEGECPLIQDFIAKEVARIRGRDDVTEVERK